MSKKKTTKQIRAIDRIIKFQIDDGIESLTISGKEVLADLSVDKKNNVTLFLNADKDKLNEIQSLVPFIKVVQKETGEDPDKKKAVDLVQDLRDFALELASDSEQLATIIKEESSITIDFAQLITHLNKMKDDIFENRKTAETAERKADNAQETADNAKQTADDALVSADTAYKKAEDIEKELPKFLKGVLPYDTEVVPMAEDFFLASEIPSELIRKVGTDIFAGDLFQWLTDLKAFLSANLPTNLSVNRFSRKILDKVDLLGTVTTDRFGNMVVNPSYVEDLSTVDGYFLTTAEFSTVLKLNLAVKVFYPAGTRAYNLQTSFETPNKSGLNYYNVFNLLNIGKLLVSGYDQKYRSGYKNFFNMALELNLVPIEKFADKTSPVSKTVLINITPEMLVSGKETEIILGIEEQNVPSKISITPTLFTIDQTITNDKYELTSGGA